MMSSLEKQFNEALKDENINIISFDIFETLVFRFVSSPKDIFYLMGENQYVKDIFLTARAFQQYRIMAEGLARKKQDKREDITLDEIYEQLPLNKEQKTFFIDLEIAIENRNLFINDKIESWIVKANEYGKSVILISDMYLSKKQIEYLVLQKLKNPKIIKELYVSSMYGKTKAKSSMYRYIKDELSVSYENWLHIGDNHISDFVNPMQLGMKALYYNVDSYVIETFKLEDLYIQKNFNRIKNFRVLAALDNPYKEDENRFYYNFGAIIFGPLLWEFSNWIKEIYEKFELSQVNFIMREGFIFEKYFKKIFPNIETNIIYASRKSTFLAIQDEKNFKIDKLDFYTYRDFTIADFYLLYQLKIDNKIIEENKFVQYKDSNIVYIGEERLLDIFMNDIYSKEEIIRGNIIQQKKLIIEYFKQLNVKSTSLLIDFGGTGTVFKRFDNILENKIKVNGLFYMHQGGFRNQASKGTISFLPYEDSTKYALELIARTPEFIEFLLNGVEKTTLSYKKELEVKPVLMYPYSGIENKKEMINAFYKGIDCYFDKIKAHKSIEENREFLTLMLARTIDVPLEKEVNYLGNLLHDEGGGSGLVKKIVSNESIDLISKIGIEDSYRNFLKRIRYKRNEVHWIQGNITSLDKNYIMDMKGLSSTDVNKNAINYFLDILDQNIDIKKINIYGAGDFLDNFKGFLIERDIEIVSVIDSRANIETFYYDNYLVQSLNNAIDTKNLYPILISSVAFAEEITENVIKYAYNNNLKLTIINTINGLFEI